MNRDVGLSVFVLEDRRSFLLVLRRIIGCGERAGGIREDEGQERGNG